MYDCTEIPSKLCYYGGHFVIILHYAQINQDGDNLFILSISLVTVSSYYHLIYLFMFLQRVQLNLFSNRLYSKEKIRELPCWLDCFSSKI